MDALPLSLTLGVRDNAATTAHAMTAKRRPSDRVANPWSPSGDGPTVSAASVDPMDMRIRRGWAPCLHATLRVVLLREATTGLRSV